MKRSRPTTACAVCRDRRVKCDRERPICSNCKKGGRVCGYLNNEPPKLEFVTDPGIAIASMSNESKPKYDTWKSVIKDQVDLVNKSFSKPVSSDSALPLWSLTYVNQPTKAVDLFSTDKIILQQSAASVRALGEHYLVAFRDKLPANVVCEEYFNNFLLGVHPIIPVCHVPTLQLEYSGFLPSLSLDTPLETVVLFLAILYTGAANSNRGESGSDSLAIRSLFEEIFQSVDFTAFYHTLTSIQLLQGFIIMHMFRVSQLAPFSAFGFLAQTIRFAQSLRLNVEQESGSVIEREVRRRIWWHLVYLDVESTIPTSLQGIIRSDEYSTQLPSVFGDTEISTVGGFQPQFSPALKISSMMVAMQGQWQWAHWIKKWFERMPNQEEIIHFSRLIQHLSDMLGNTVEDEWARVYLKLQVDRAYCMLGLRFWQLHQFKGTDCESEVVRTARSFLTKYVHLATMPQTPHLHWFVSGFVQPLHASMILLLHLSSCPVPSNEITSSRDLLDHVMRLRLSHKRLGTIIPVHATLPQDNQSYKPRTNAKYHALVMLYSQVWLKNGWPLQTVEHLRFGNHKNVQNEPSTPPPKNSDSAIVQAQSAPGEDEFSMLLDESLFDFDAIQSDPMEWGGSMDAWPWDEWEAVSANFFAAP